MVEGRDLPQREHAQLANGGLEGSKMPIPMGEHQCYPQGDPCPSWGGQPHMYEVDKWNMHRHLAIVGIQHKREVGQAHAITIEFQVL